MARLEGKKTNTGVIVASAIVFAIAAALLFRALKPVQDVASGGANATSQNRATSTSNEADEGGGSSTPIPLATIAAGTSGAISGVGDSAANNATGAESAPPNTLSTGNQASGQANALPSATPATTAPVVIATAAPTVGAPTTTAPTAAATAAITLPRNPLSGGAVGNAGKMGASPAITPASSSGGGNTVSGGVTANNVSGVNSASEMVNGTASRLTRPPLARSAVPSSPSVGAAPATGY